MAEIFPVLPTGFLGQKGFTNRVFPLLPVGNYLLLRRPIEKAKRSYFAGSCGCKTLGLRFVCLDLRGSMGENAKTEKTRKRENRENDANRR